MRLLHFLNLHSKTVQPSQESSPNSGQITLLEKRTTHMDTCKPWTLPELTMAFLGAQMVKNLPMMQDSQETWVQSLGQEWLPTPVFFLQSRECHGQRSLAGYSPRDHKSLDTTE